MHIVSALRRKRDEIAATIAAYEARIDAARMDLAALERAARLFDPEDGGDKMGQHRESERPEVLAGNPIPRREVWESDLPPVRRQSTLPVARAEGSHAQDAGLSQSIGVLEPRLPGKVLRLDLQEAGVPIPDEFFYLNRP